MHTQPTSGTFKRKEEMAKNKIIETVKSNSKKRKGVHSKNASKNQNAYKQKYRGQGR